MAIFEGSIQEFHHFIGPKIKNAINLLAKRDRDARNGWCEGSCERTGQTLESAHIHGRGRRTIIERVLSAHTVNDTVRCDIKMVEKEILEAHKPISNTFKFLCKRCHTAYDIGTRAGKTSTLKQRVSLSPSKTMPTSADIKKVHLIFFPKDEGLFREQLVKNKKAYVLLHKIDGSVEPVKKWNARRFEKTSNLRGNIFSGFLRGWKKKGHFQGSFLD